MTLWRPAWRWVFQWPQWWKWREYNWINFYPVRIGLEAGTYKGNYVEIECVILGVGFVFELYHTDTREVFADEMKRRLREAEDGKFFTFSDCDDCGGKGYKWEENDRE